MKQRKRGVMIAWRFWNYSFPVFYVQNIPGDGGVDWGYTNDVAKALPLNKYFAARFRKDCERVNATAHFQFIGENHDKVTAKNSG